MRARTSNAAPHSAGQDGGIYTQAMAQVSRLTPRQAPAKPRRAKANTRLNKVGVVLYVEPQVNKALRQAALDLDTSVHALGLAGLLLLLERLEIKVEQHLLPSLESLLPASPVPARPTTPHKSQRREA